MALLAAKNQGEIGVLQFKMQNEIIEKNLQELEKKKEEYLKLSQEIQSQNYKNAEEKRLIKNIDLLLSLDPSEWTNAMLKTVFGGFVVDVNGTIKADIIYQNPERSNLGINIFGTKELLQWLDSLLPMSLTSLLGYTA
ncbi:MAG: hypothetical protein PWP67_2926 [Clostridium butyricum]|nr:hypothetical protein [Clostridium butyricum]MDN5318009.1 hypothetical protein [Thermoanaerobacterium sp.]